MKVFLKSIITLLLVLTFILSFSKNTLANDYYVSTSGSDTNSGSASAPFRTFAKSMTVLASGDTLYVYGGTYSERLEVTKSGTSSAPINIKEVQGHTVTLSAGGTDYPVRVADTKSYINLSGFEVKNASVVCVYISGSHINIKDFDVHNCGKFGYRLTGTYITVENSTCHDSVLENYDSTTQMGGKLEPGGWGACMRTGVGSSNVIIRNNHIYNNYGEGLIIGQVDGLSAYDNLVHDNYSQNIYIGNSLNVDVYKNMTYSTNPDYFRVNTNPAKPANCIAASEETISDAWGARLSNIRVFNNIAYSCKIGVGYTYKEVPNNGCNNCLFAYNTIVNTQGIKIIGGTKNNVLIVNNIVNGGSFDLGTGNIVQRSNLLTNPSFATTPNTNPTSFRLAVNSSAIGSAEAVSGITTDYEGKNRGSGTDIGAIEFSGSSVTPTVVPTTVAVPTPTTSPTYNPSDLEPDGDVDVNDFILLVSNFGLSGVVGWIRSDIIKNGIIDIFDFNKLITNFGL